MKDKNVIVTGGLGFIGSHIVDSLLEDNKVTIIDNMSTGKLENLENPNHENLSIIEEDLLEADLDEILKGMDYVFHLAALASVPINRSKKQWSRKDSLLIIISCLWRKSQHAA